METKHAMFSPSGASRWFVCAGSAAMEFGLPDNGNDYSAEGSCSHAVAKMCFTEGKPAGAYIGRHVQIGPHETYEFTEDMAEPTQCYVDFVNSLAGEKHFEVAVPIDHITKEAGAEGTADVVVLDEGMEEITVVDLKFGRGVYVEAVQNKQGLMYASGVVRKYDVVGSIARINIIIHQPRISETPSVWTCSIEELRAFEKEAEARAWTAMHAFKFRENWMGKKGHEQYLTPGDEQCKFCKAKATCNALTEFTQTNVGESFESLAVIPRESVNIPAPIVALYGLTDEQLSTRMKACDLIEVWVKAVRAEVERRLLANIPVPGFKIVEGRLGNRAWSDEAAAEEMLRKQFRLPIEQAYNLKLISPTQAEAIAPKFDKKGKVKAGQADTPIGERQWAKLQPLITRAPGKKSVAPEADPRPALAIIPVADEFVAEDGSDLA